MKAAVLGLPIALLTACTHQHIVSTLHPDSASSPSATAQLADGRKVEVRAASTPHGPGWFAQPTAVGAPWTPVDAFAIRSYTVFRRGRGVFEGGAWGAVIGTLLGAALGYAGGDTPCRTESCLLHLGKEENAVLGAFYLGQIGIGIGSAVGALSRSRDVYQIGSDAEPSGSARIVPSNRGAGVAWSF